MKQKSLCSHLKLHSCASIQKGLEDHTPGCHPGLGSSQKMLLEGLWAGTFYSNELSIVGVEGEITGDLAPDKSHLY